MSRTFVRSDSSGATVLVSQSSNRQLVRASQPQRQVVLAGVRGRPGVDGQDGWAVSPDPDNRLEGRGNGLFVSDTLTPDPLAYYILAKS